MVNSHLPSADRVCRIEMMYQFQDETWYNVYHVRKPELWTVESLLLCASLLTSWEVDWAAPHRSNSVALTTIRLTDLTSPTSPMLVYTVPGTIPGGLGSPILPGNVTVAIQGVTGSRGAGRQARSYWIGLCIEQVEGDQIANSEANAIVEALDNLLRAFDPLGPGELVVLHRTLNGVQLDPAQAESLTHWVLRDRTTDSQISRLPDHKRAR